MSRTIRRLFLGFLGEFQQGIGLDLLADQLRHLEGAILQELDRVLQLLTHAETLVKLPA